MRLRTFTQITRQNLKSLSKSFINSGREVKRKVSYTMNHFHLRSHSLVRRERRSNSYLILLLRQNSLYSTLVLNERLYFSETAIEEEEVQGPITLIRHCFLPCLETKVLYLYSSYNSKAMGKYLTKHETWLLFYFFKHQL